MCTVRTTGAPATFTIVGILLLRFASLETDPLLASRNEMVGSIDLCIVDTGSKLILQMNVLDNGHYHFIPKIRRLCLLSATPSFVTDISPIALCSFSHTYCKAVVSLAQRAFRTASRLSKDCSQSHIQSGKGGRSYRAHTQTKEPNI